MELLFVHRMIDVGREWRNLNLEKILLKKYSNRRLYNTNSSEYVTLQEVADLIHQGLTVEVIDAKSKEDVTALILTQIVLEEARQNNCLLPIPLLYTIIKYGDNLLAEFFESYLQKSIKNFIEYKAATAAQYDKWLELAEGMKELTQKSADGTQLYQELFEKFFGHNQKWAKNGKD